MNYLYFFIFASVFNLSSNFAYAKDLGAVGEVFGIWEEDILDVIQTKLSHMERNGELEQKQETIRTKISNSLRNPSPVQGIVHTVKEREYEYDPSIEVKQDILGLYGTVIHKAGTKLNPLDYVSLPSELLFIDGRAQEHVSWAVSQYKKSSTSSVSRIILTAGSPLDLEKDFSIPIYFDQAGVYTKKFGIKQVPARLHQRGKVLLIKELKPEVGGGI